MNPINLKIVSLPIDYKTDIKGKSLVSGKDSGDFFSLIRKLMNSTQEKSFNSPSEPPRAGLPIKKGHFFYLESLRKGLLGKGKPLNKISLNSNDLPILKKLLYQCGFSQENAEKFLKELLQNNPRGEINLSQFFLKISELGPPKRNIYQPITLEPSAIPYIESALRDLGLTTKEVEHVLASARVEGGGLDLNKFVIKLKGISNKEIPLQNKVKLDQFVKEIEQVVGRSAGFKDLTPENQVKPVHNLAHQISKKLEGMGIQIPDKGKGGQVSIKDLITALEQTTGGSGKGNRLPTDVKATIDQILERVVIAGEKDGAISSMPYFSKLRLANLHSKEKIGKTGKTVERESLLSPLKEKGNINNKNGQQISPLKEKDNINNKNGQQKVESFFPSKEAKLFSGLDARQVLEKGNTEDGNVVKSETRIMDIPHGIKGSTFSEAINTVKQHSEPVRNFLPAYLIDQVVKQISRSILRGERVIRLQLKPPELGVLKVEVDIKDNILKLGMTTENSSVKQLLLSNVHELRAALIEQGVKLERFDVQMNYNFDQSLANSKEGLKEGQGQDLNGMPFIAEADTEDPISGARNMAEGDHLLDLVA